MPDDVIVVQGGSVSIEHSAKFKDEPNGNRKKSKQQDATLKEVRVNGVKVSDLAKTDKVEIVYSEP